MASVEKRVRDGRTTWLARWRDPDGRQRKKSFPRRVDAERFVTAVSADMLRGQYVDPQDPTTVAEYAKRYAAIQPHGVRTAARVDAYIRKHLEELPLGRMRLQRVRASDVQAWATDRADVLADSTLRNTVSFLRSVFAAALHDGLISRDPTRRVRLPEAADKRVTPLTVAQVRAIHDAMPRRQAAIVIAQAGLGLRAGEVLGLRLADVDFLRREVTISHQLEPGAREGTRTAPKTRRSRRVVPLPQVVANAIAAHLAEWPAADDGSIWTTLNGGPPRHEHYYESIAKAVAKVNGREGEDAVRVPANTTSHAFRHHYASVLIAAGASVIEVGERLGHKDGSLVLRTYGHLFEGREDRTRRAIDAAWTDDRAPEVPRDQASEG
jgi:integrase